MNNKKHSEETKQKISKAITKANALKSQALTLKQARPVKIELKNAQTTDIVDLTPQKIRSILNSSKSGDLTKWASFCEKMNEEDSHLAGLVSGRVNAVAYSDFYIEPASNDALAKAAADAVRMLMFGELTNRQQLFAWLLNAPYFGLSIAFNQWRNVGKWWSLVCSDPVDLKLFRYDQDFCLECKQTGEYLKDFPFSWIVHKPIVNSLYPNRAGLFRPAAWLYFFKRAGIADMMAGSHKYAYGHTIATLGEGAKDDAIEETWTNLKAMAADNIIVVKSPTKIETLNQSTAAGGTNMWLAIAENMDKAYSKLIVGGTLTVETDGKGSYTLGEVHERTRRDILNADAKALAETITKHLIVPYLKLNSHLFGGRMPPVPTIWFDVKPYIDLQPWHIENGLVTKNDGRESLGLSRILSSEGGDEFFLNSDKVLGILGQMKQGIISQDAARLLLKRSFMLSPAEIEILVSPNSLGRP